MTATETPPVVRDRRRALLIGVTNTSPETKFQPLPGAEHDVNAMARILRQHRDEETSNFEVESHIVGPTSPWTSSDLLQSVELALEDAKHFLFYFSGHGHVTNFGLQLVTPDKQAPLDAGIYFDTLLHRFNRASSTEITIILDCCYAGSAGDASFEPDGAGSLDRDVLRRFTHLRDGISILASSNWMERSWAVREGLSDFTKQLTSCLHQPGPIDVLDLYKWAKTHVPEQSPVIRTFGSVHSALRVDDATEAEILGLI